VKVVQPSRLLAEAADVLSDVRNDVVVVGAAALEVALSDDASVVITPTRDVDVVVPVDRAEAVVAHLEAADMRRSEVEHERAFTWVRGDLKVQLVRDFHPFAKPPARALPSNPVFAMAASPVHQVSVSFSSDSNAPRLRCANAACLLALKQAAFGRTRPTDDRPVERDYHDAYLLISAVPHALAEELSRAEYEVRTRAIDAVGQLSEGGIATVAAGHQMVRLRVAPSQRVAEANVRRAANRMLRLLATRTGGDRGSGTP
jgi:hypothetical protein